MLGVFPWRDPSHIEPSHFWTLPKWVNPIKGPFCAHHHNKTMDTSCKWKPPKWALSFNDSLISRWIILFTGSELVDWVMSNLSIEDRGERLCSLLTKLSCSIPVGMGHCGILVTRTRCSLEQNVRGIILYQKSASYFLTGYKLSIN